VFPVPAMKTATLTPALKVSYPPELPVGQRNDEVAAAIRDHQVVVVAGETGSGKTTQLLKICLELGRGVTGQIGHAQPRRIAARTVAERIAEELGTELGTAAGYKVRFTDKSSDGTQTKVMTDGILLAEMQRDRQLRRYDTLIIDEEAHERNLNIDFILGYLKRLLPARPDLKLRVVLVDDRNRLTSTTTSSQCNGATPRTWVPAPMRSTIRRRQGERGTAFWLFFGHVRTETFSGGENVRSRCAGRISSRFQYPFVPLAQREYCSAPRKGIIVVRCRQTVTDRR
jgi:energy-coupling factor transporter ATP-binding protein EcfA2